MRYLLDTNILSEMVDAGIGSRALARMEEVGAAQCCTSVIVAGEALYGVEKRGSARLKAAVTGVLARLPVLPLSEPAPAHYSRLRVDLERLGMPIGSNDLLIAAHCLALGAILVTDNVREFERVAGLTVENWLR